MRDELLAIFVGAFSILSTSLAGSGLIDENWQKPTPRNRLDPEILDSVDVEVVEFWQKLKREMDKYPKADLERYAKQVQEAIQHLPDGQENVNFLALSLNMIAIAGYDTGGAYTVLFANPAIRLIDKIRGEVAKEEATLPLMSYRAADNIYRYLTGRPMLDNEIRDARAKRWRKNV